MPFINTLEGNPDGGWNNFFSSNVFIGFYFVFIGVAFISIVVWVFNWICWYHQCCCFDFLHNPTNKRFAWWLCVVFFLGVLACCISAFVTVNRFGFALQGTWCGISRMYYDSKFGQLKLNTPRWEGFTNITNILDQLNKFSESIYNKDKEGSLNTDLNKFEVVLDKNKATLFNNVVYLTNNIQAKLTDKDEALIKYIPQLLPFLKSSTRIIDDIKQIKNLYDESKEMKIPSDIYTEKNFTKIETEFLDEFEYYAKILNAFFKILAMIYYCLLSIAVACALVSLIFFTCLRRQGYLKIFMIVLWNFIRFFIVSFFCYGTAYGIAHIGFKNAIGYVMYIFDINLNKQTKLINGGKNFYKFCLLGNDHNIKNKFDDYFKQLATPLNDFFSSYVELKNLKEVNSYSREILTNINNIYTNIICTGDLKEDCDSLYERATKKGGLFASFDCGFLKSNLQQIYRAIYDAAVESNILSALSLCTAFFGAIGVYFFLLVLHHYNNELFYNSGDRIFTGMGGPKGVDEKNKKKMEDPAYKKRKLKAEIESSSSMEVGNGIKEQNKQSG